MCPLGIQRKDGTSSASLSQDTAQIGAPVTATVATCLLHFGDLLMVAFCKGRGKFGGCFAISESLRIISPSDNSTLES